MQVTNRQMGISTRAVVASTGNEPPLIMAQTGRISAMSMMFAPIMLPTPSEGSFLTNEETVVTSSGRLVPMAMAVKPIIFSETPNMAAMALPLSTNSSEPMTMAAAPMMSRTIFLRSRLFSRRV